MAGAQRRACGALCRRLDYALLRLRRVDHATRFGRRAPGASGRSRVATLRENSERTRTSLPGRRGIGARVLSAYVLRSRNGAWQVHVYGRPGVRGCKIPIAPDDYMYGIDVDSTQVTLVTVRAWWPRARTVRPLRGHGNGSLRRVRPFTRAIGTFPHPTAGCQCTSRHRVPSGETNASRTGVSIGPRSF